MSPLYIDYYTPFYNFYQIENVFEKMYTKQLVGKIQLKLKKRRLTYGWSY